MSVLICSTKYGGCGYIGDGGEWGNGDDTGDWIICPVCSEDRAFQLTEENIRSLTDDDNYAKARMKLGPVLLNTKDRVLALKDGDHVLIPNSQREFVVYTFNPPMEDEIWFHGGISYQKETEYKIVYLRKKDGFGIAVWTREELWKALKSDGYFIGV